MHKLIRSIDVDREPEAVFDLLADPTRFPEFFVGITRWERCSTKDRGLGAEFRVLMRVGSIEAGGIVRVTDWQEPLTIAYDLAGGPIGRLVELTVARVIGGNMTATMLALRRILEFEERPRGRVA